MALTATQRSMLRRRAGDSNTAFDDPTLDAIWEEVANATSDTQRIEAALYLMFEAIASGAVKLHDIQAGQSANKLSQVFDHAKKMMELYKSSYDAALSQRKQVSIGVILPAVHPTRRYPSEDERS